MGGTAFQIDAFQTMDLAFQIAEAVAQFIMSVDTMRLTVMSMSL